MKLFSLEKTGQQKEELFAELNAFKKKVEEHAKVLNREVMTLNYISGSTNAAIKAVNGSIAEINEGNNTLVDHIREINEISSFMGNDIEENAGHMNNLVTVSEEMTESNKKLRIIFEELLSDNRGMVDRIEEIAANTHQANQDTKEIMRVISIINSIANKTNMLSLNASIEAARAGEAGRGFAVVATEIRNLAEMSRKSAENIGIIIEKLIQQSELTVESIQNVREAFARQSQSMEETRKLLDHTEKKIDEVIHHVKQVDYKLEKLTKSKDTILVKMEDLTGLGMSNSEATEMIASDFRKVMTHSSNMRKLAYKLTSVSEELQYFTREEQENEMRSRMEKKKLRIGYMPNYGSLCSIIPAIRLGYTQKENLEIELVKYANGMLIIDALKEGKLEAGYIGDGAHKRCITGDAKIFLLSHVSNAEAVYGNRKSGVRKLASMKGMRIGTIEGSTSDTILNFALESGGLKRADCEIVNSTPEEIIQDMVAGRLDACALWSPYTFELQEAMGNDAILLANNLNYSNRLASLSSWITTEKFAQENAEVLLRLTRALYRGMDYRAMEDNTRDVARWISEMTGLSEEGLYAQRKDADWSTKGYVALGVSDGTVEQLYQAQQNQFIKNGNITSMVPVNSYVLLDNMKNAIE